MRARLFSVSAGLCVAAAWSAFPAESEETPSEDRAGGPAKVVTEAAKKVVDMAKGAPPVAPGEQLDRYARSMTRFMRPLSLPMAIVATLVGFALLLFGRKLFRVGSLLYMMAIMGLVGRAVGGLFEGEWSALAGGLIGCLVGAGVSVPLRVAVRFLIGAFAGGILAFVVVQAFTSSTLVTLFAAAAGIVVSGFLTFVYPTPLLIVGFSMFGAALASVGILSVATEPAEGAGGAAYLQYRPAHVAGLVLAAVLGGIFQSQFEVSESENT